MRFFSTVVAGAAIVAGVLAQKPTIDTTLSEVTAGEPVEIKYSPASATATFILRKGSPGNLDTLATITESATGGKFTWNVPNTLTDDTDYALEIVVDGEINYTGQFEVSGGSGVSSAASSATPSATASASATESDSESYSATITASEVSSTGSSSSVSGTISGTISASSGSNSTVTSATLSTSATGTASTTGSEDATSTGDLPPESTGAASSLSSSPLALIFGAVAAMVYLN